MILELVDILIHEGQQAEFDLALKRGLNEVIAKAKGFSGYQINRGIESPERYMVLIYWETVENHMIDFRESAAFLKWRSFVAPYFARPPIMEHFTISGKYTD